ncbi:Alkaline phosphatase (plasmid) [Euzebya pacifica]|uniref:Alkaline phosphatase n=1 Tax=Euzebya pacifica TaxID=1608957 RepID=A0A346Y6K0_9ACTN|nr:cell wall-binding repeat-containing protein [Euzebya pacifica]AXV10097.1 Alkaline phosphatase [Euzebya pacifica]
MAPSSRTARPSRRDGHRWRASTTLLAPFVVVALVGVAAATVTTGQRGTGRLFEEFTVLTSPDPTGAALALTGHTHRTAGTVLLGRADVFADSLASATLQTDRPLLLTGPTDLDPRVAAELDRLETSHVIVLGGSAAIDDTVTDALADRGVAVTRHAGPDRTGTAVAVADAGAGSDTVLLVRGYGPEGNPTAAFADSLSVGGVAAANGWPVLLTTTDSLSPATRDWLADRRPDRMVVVGGTAAITDRVVEAVAPFVGSVARVAGDTRFTTAATIATTLTGLDDVGRLGTVIVADGTSDDAWAAGFAASHTAATTGGPIVLLDTTGRVPAATAEILARGGTHLLCLAGVDPDVCAALAAPAPQQPHGTVLVDGAGPLEGATVTLEHVDDPTVPPVTATTGPDGTWTASAPAGRWTVVVDHPTVGSQDVTGQLDPAVLTGHDAGPFLLVWPDGNPATSGSVDAGTVTLAVPTVDVTGRVTGPAGSPIDGATVTATTRTPARQAPPMTRTGPDGTFVLQLRPGQWTLRVTAPGHTTGTRDLTVHADGTVEGDLTSPIVLATPPAGPPPPAPDPTVDIRLDSPAGVGFDATGIAPGYRQAVDYVVGYDGDPARVTLSATVDGPLATHLHVEVITDPDTDPTVVFTGTLADLAATGTGVTWEPTGPATRTYRMTVSLPDDTGDDVQGTSASATFTWTADA